MRQTQQQPKYHDPCPDEEQHQQRPGDIQHHTNSAGGAPSAPTSPVDIRARSPNRPVGVPFRKPEGVHNRSSAPRIRFARTSLEKTIDG